MRIRIDLKILIFLFLFYLTNQMEIYLTIMFFCIIHELGHIIMGLLLKLKPEKLEIMPCGLAICFKANSGESKLEIKNILIALAGPLISLTLAIVYTYIDIQPVYITKENIVYSNILILLFNLMPLYPLDGGRIIKGILHIKFGEDESLEIINKISNVTMIAITIISSIAVYYFKNIAIFLICLFLWIITLKENEKLRMEKNIKTLAILDRK